MDYTEKEAAREAKNAYYREWRRKNPEKVRTANQRYWLKQGKKLLEKGGGHDGQDATKCN